MLTQDDLARQVGYLTLHLWDMIRERDQLAAEVRRLAPPEEKIDAPVSAPPDLPVPAPGG